MTAAEASRTDAPDARSARPALIVLAVMLVVYGVSVCPVVFWGDSAEFSRRALDVDLVPIARGYPLHRVLCWAAGRIAGDAAFGANCVSAVFGAVSVALTFEIARRLGRSDVAGVCAAGVTGFAHTFWMYSTVAEVYTLHTALMLGAILLAVVADAGGAKARYAVGVVLGLSLLHHRMIVFTVPGLALWMWTGTPAKERLRGIGHVVVGGLVGAIPFVVLCVVASRSPPAGVENRAVWWFKDVFMGGEENAQYMTGDGKKGLVGSAVYLARFVVLSLPGPALLLAAAGFAAAGRRVALCLGVLVAANCWFPLRYDWTGDQYTFLIPLYPLLAVAAGVAVGRIRETRGARTAALATAGVVLAPVVVYAGCAFTSLGGRLLPGLRPEAARTFFWPVRMGDSRSRDWCAERLAGLPPNARLHADWGDGEVYLYLQAAQGLRRDVTIEVWNKDVVLGDGRGEEWLSMLPFTREPPAPVAKVLARLEPRGDGLFRVKQQ